MKFKKRELLDDSLPDPHSVSNGQTPLKRALQDQAIRLPHRTRVNTLKPNEKVDPVLRHHLRLDD